MLVTLKKNDCVKRRFSVAGVQNNVPCPLFMLVLEILHRLVAASIMPCDVVDYVSMRHCFKLQLVSVPTVILYTRSCINPQVLHSTGLSSRLMIGHRSGEMNSVVSCWKRWTVLRAQCAAVLS